MSEPVDHPSGEQDVQAFVVVQEEPHTISDASPPGDGVPMPLVTEHATPEGATATPTPDEQRTGAPESLATPSESRHVGLTLNLSPDEYQRLLALAGGEQETLSRQLSTLLSQLTQLEPTSREKGNPHDHQPEPMATGQKREREEQPIGTICADNENTTEPPSKGDGETPSATVGIDDDTRVDGPTSPTSIPDHDEEPSSKKTRLGETSAPSDEDSVEPDSHTTTPDNGEDATGSLDSNECPSTTDASSPDN